MSVLLECDAPVPSKVPPTVEQWLAGFGTAVWMRWPGRREGRPRVVSTLLHGNEPSGLRALHDLLSVGFEPAVTSYVFLGAVEAALVEPRLSTRHLADRRDLNRCFRGPFATDREGQRAEALLERLEALDAEALIDVHNTSGSGPAFAVATRASPSHRRLAALFSPWLIRTSIELGALMEVALEDCPIVTAECGGAAQRKADRVAREGIAAFLGADALFDGDDPPGAAVLENPIRVELMPDAQVAYATEPVAAATLTLRGDIDRLNFEVVAPGTALGWTNGHGTELLRLSGATGDPRGLFLIEDGVLRTRHPLRLFMATTNARIARSDCLFYALDESPKEP
jgi:hypothetical protein